MNSSIIYKACLEYLELMNQDKFITAISSKTEDYDLEKMSFKDAIERKARYLKGKTVKIKEANIDDVYDFQPDDEEVTLQGLFRCEVETVLTSLPVLPFWKKHKPNAEEVVKKAFMRFETVKCSETYPFDDVACQLIVTECVREYFNDILKEAIHG